MGMIQMSVSVLHAPMPPGFSQCNVWEANQSFVLIAMCRCVTWPGLGLPPPVKPR
jgi:hypothetical protein